MKKTVRNEEKDESFDARLTRVQEIVAALEEGKLPLEEGLTLYKEGMALAGLCREQLKRARNEITLCDEAGERPFDPENAPEENGDAGV
jgi:exodeoxyribonuclease VII small subunit